MKNKIKRIVCMLLTICVFTISQLSIAFAENPIVEVVNGVADFGKGEASITVQGKKGHSLARKTWKVHQLFSVENAEGLESVQYTFNEKYKETLQKIIAVMLDKDEDAVTEYDTIDYIQKFKSFCIFRKFKQFCCNLELFCI